MIENDSFGYSSGKELIISWLRKDEEHWGFLFMELLGCFDHFGTSSVFFLVPLLFKTLLVNCIKLMINRKWIGCDKMDEDVLSLSSSAYIFFKEVKSSFSSHYIRKDPSTTQFFKLLSWHSYKFPSLFSSLEIEFVLIQTKCAWFLSLWRIILEDEKILCGNVRDKMGWENDENVGS